MLPCVGAESVDLPVANHDTKLYEKIKRINFASAYEMRPFESHGYVIFPSSMGIHLHQLLEKDAAFLKELVDKDDIKKPKKELKKLFEAIHHYDGERNGPCQDEIVQKELVKNTWQGMIFRYPSYQQVENFFGPSAALYAKEILKKWLIGDELWQLLNSDGYEAVKKICDNPLSIDQNKIFFSYNSDECVSALEQKLKYELFTMAYISWNEPEDAVSHLRTILKAGIDINVKNNKGKTVLSKCCPHKRNHLLLLQHGANPNVKDDNGWCPLLWMALYSDIDQIKLLLTFGARSDRFIMQKVVTMHMLYPHLRPTIQQILETVCDAQMVDCCK